MSILKIEPQIANSTANFSFGNVFASNFYYANGAIFSGGGSGTVKYTAATTPPSSNNSPGDQWFNTTSQVLYEYINDGTGNYWVDILTPTITTSFTGNSMVSGNSNVVVNSNSNVTISASGTSNVLVASNIAVTVTGNIVGTGDLYIGNGAAATTFTNPIAIFKDTGLTYVQAAIVNSNGNGSADITTYGNNGDDSQSWTDIGFTGNTFNDSNYSVTSAGDGYLFVQGNSSFGGNLVIATGNTGTTKDIVFATGGFTSSNIKARLYNSNGTFSVTNTLSGGNISTTGTLTANSITTGNATITGNLLVSGAFTMQQTYEVVNVVGTMGATVTYDFTIGGTYYHASPSAAWIANINNLPTTANRILVVALIISQGATGYIPSAYQINGSAVSVKWVGGSAPTASTSKTDIISLSCMYTSGAWTVYGQGASYS